MTSRSLAPSPAIAGHGTCVAARAPRPPVRLLGLAVVLTLTTVVMGAAAPTSASASATTTTTTTNEGARAPAWHRPDLPGALPAKRPLRIVSLAPVLTETMFALGAGARVVGVTAFCDRPVEAQRLPRVGGATGVSIERLLALEPDLVVAVPTLGQRDALELARAAGIPVRVIHADRLGEVLDMVADLGVILDARDEARALGARIDRALAQLSGLSIDGRRAAVVVGHEPLVVAGPGTFSADVLALTGLTSAVPPGAPLWPAWSVESVAAARVDVLLLAEGPAHAPALRALLARAGLKAQVVAPPRPVLMRPGPALIEDAALLATVLVPSLAVTTSSPQVPSRGRPGTGGPPLHGVGAP